MTDEKLIRLLRLGEWGGAGDEEMVLAADRIEQLVKERDAWVGHAKAAIWTDSEELKLAEASLAKAVEALKGVLPYWDKANPLRLADHHHDGHDCDRCKFDHARAVLAELEKTE